VKPETPLLVIVQYRFTLLLWSIPEAVVVGVFSWGLLPAVVDKMREPVPVGAPVKVMSTGAYTVASPISKVCVRAVPIYF
jgi:hypothetical protein